MKIGTRVFCSLLCVMLVGCSKAKNTVIPQDPKKWDSIAEQIKSLDDEEKRLATAYLMRMGVAAAFGGSPIPAGTTVGDAIKQEKDFEAKNKAEEAAAQALKAQAQAAQAAAIAKMSHLVTFASLSIRILPKDIEAGRFSPQISVPFVIKNNTEKEISGVKGTIVLEDLFGAPLQKLQIAADHSIPAGAQVTMPNYVWDLNQFQDADQHLMSVDLNKIKALFQPAMIVFADGTKEVAPEVP
ncbi:MAG TPA: hypothetical protein VJP60_01540 [Rhizomicrobium sp.]|nr:hypothetical protein [Rhizomicrobium sp.]